MTKNDQKEKKQDEKQINKKEIEELKTQNQELEAQVKRVLTDYQNLQKRTLEELKEWIRTANKDLLLRLLPVLDTLILASKHSEDKNLQVSTQQFLDVLRNEGVERVETVGKQFDPSLMECIITGEGEEGKVIEEIRAGYTLNDTVIRPAQVKVGKE